MGHEPPGYLTSIMADEGQPVAQIIDAYRAGPGRLRASLHGMDGEQLRARPVAGKWSTLEVLGHLCDCEQFLTDRMKRTVALDLPLLVGVDGAPYMKALSYQERSVEPQLTLIEITRDQCAEDLDRLGDDAWSRTAVHTEVGLVTLRQLLVHTTKHLELHVAAIAEKRAALGL